MTLGQYLGAGSGVTNGLYHLNGNSNDSSGNSRNGTDSGGVTYGLAYGRLGQGALYDGVDDYTNIGASSINASAGTVSWLMKPVAITDTCRPFSDNGGYFFTEFNGSNQMQGVLYDGGGKVTGYLDLSTSAWNLWTLVWDSSNLILYKDNGATSASVAAGAIADTSYDFYLGGIATVFSNVQMCEVIVENVAWSRAKVARHYQQVLGRLAMMGMTF